MPSTPPPKPAHLLHVKPYHGEQFRFMVESEHAALKDGETWEDHAYLVDIHAEPVIRDGKFICWNSRCGCMDYRTRRAKAVREGRMSRCKHILRARSFFLDLHLNSIPGQSQDGP